MSVRQDFNLKYKKTSFKNLMIDESFLMHFWKTNEKLVIGKILIF